MFDGCLFVLVIVVACGCLFVGFGLVLCLFVLLCLLMAIVSC